ncbi:hypothetical protein HK414_21865 [Ramlibacter terrae]|uniref:DUF349 domain-containing protein n=1 Tax=Ramlibacter terrae TaxID=2732511 RepID=A0ABX6P7N8_9BURK|nr:hypothetical protein HK414_21865 [Ramlibacter terrae]
MSDSSDDRTASLMTPAKLAQLQTRPKAAASPAAWLDQLATDAGSGHARRLVDLRRQLEAQVRERDYEAMRSALHSLYEDLKKLDYEAIQPKGWLSRTLRLGKEEAAGFVAQYERALRTGEDVSEEVSALQRRQQAAEGATERALVEFDVEVRAIEKIMEQGARWLQDMRNQLKAREAQRGDPAVQQQVREDTARCELLVARLKELRAAVSAAQQVAERCKAGAARRAAFLQMLQEALAGEWQAWRRQLDPVASELVAGNAAAESLEAARGAHQKCSPR